jgi:hypothetical protein
MIGSVTKGRPEPNEPTPPSLESSSGLSKEEIFDVLSNHRRRYAVHHLIQNGETTLGELAEHVAAWEYDKQIHEVSSRERKRVYCALQQSHLPKMDTANVIEFDKNRGTVTPTEATENLDIYLDMVQGDEIPWSEYYVGLSGVAAALVVALWLRAYPLTLVPYVGWAALLVIAFGISSVAHFLDGRK